MFDFAIAGPLCGIIASLSALYFGLEMTVFTDAQSYAKFPALPLEILRQSSLGGGIVEAVLGQGALSVPDAAMGSQMVSNINIPLHPLAVAGYIGLIINALSLLPIGSKYERLSYSVLNTFSHTNAYCFIVFPCFFKKKYITISN